MSELKVVHAIKRGDNFPAVYKFTFDNGFFYIGGTRKIISRISQHRARFASRTHAANVVRASIGCSAVVFEILERIDDISILSDREDYYLRLYWGDQLLLNRAESAKGGFKRTPEEVEKHRTSALAVGYCPNRNLALKISMQKRMKENPNCLQHLRDVQKKNKVASFKNRMYIQTFESYVEAERAYGLSKGRVDKIVRGLEKTAKGYSFKAVSESGEFIEPPMFKTFGHTGGKPVKILVMDSSQNELFQCDTLSDAVKRTGVHMGTIHKVCVGKVKTAKGFIFKRLPG